MDILIVGKTGQLGCELAELVWPASFGVRQSDRRHCDLTDTDRIGQAVRDAKPDVVINAAAYTAVDRAETEPDVAMRINSDGPAALAQACAEVGAALVHISTDYVFDGTKAAAYVEDDPVDPLSVYGRTKLAGERAVRARLAEHVILRTSGVFSRYGNNFVKTMLRVGSQKQTVGVVADQTGAPTPAHALAQAIAEIVKSIAAKRAVWGTFHFAGAEAVTWFDFARAIFEGSEAHSHVRVVPIATADFGAPARRPAYSVLDCARIRDAYGIERPSWRVALAATLAQLRAMDTSP